MSPKPDVSAARKEQILAAATEVFSRKGFSAARMEDIADETGVSKGTLYLYFDSKDDLITAILDLIFQREFKQISQLDLSAISATQAIWQMIDLIVQDFIRMQHLMPVTYEFLALAFRNRVVQKAIQQYFDRYMQLLVSIIQHGIEAGEFRAVAVRDIAISIGALVEGTFLLWVYDPDQVDVEHNIRAGVQVLIMGIQAA
jgi:AcrR family transcriptional regulator